MKPNRAPRLAGDKIYPEFLELILNSVADPIFVKDSAHRWILLNDAYCTFFGASREQLLGKSDYDFFPREQADVFWEKDRIVFETGQVNENEELFTDSTGKIHTILTRKSRYFDTTGAIYLVGTIRDVTDKAESESRRLELEIEKKMRAASEGQKKVYEGIASRFRAILEVVPVGIIVLDRQGKSVNANEAAKEVWGGKTPAAEGISGYSNAHGWRSETREKLKMEDWPAVRALLRGEVSQAEVIDIMKFDGQCATILTSAAPLRDEAGNIDGAVVVHQDISRLRQTEMRLRESEALLMLAMDATGLGILDFYLERESVAVSPEASVQLGLPSCKEVSCKSFFNRIHPEDRAQLEGVLRKAHEKNVDADSLNGLRTEFRVLLSQGQTEHWIAAHWRLAPGSLDRIICVTLDITEQRQRERHITEAKDAAESASRMKSEFLDIAAHELRTPLTSITVLTELATREVAQNRSVTPTYVIKLAEQVRRLTGLVDDLLNATRLERGGLTLHRQTLDLVAIVRDVVEDFQARTRAELIVEVPKTPVLVELDPARIYQVLSNLFENANEYAPGSPIRITLETTSGQDGGVARVSVIDQGPGISKEKQYGLFTRFYRVTTDGTLQHPGLGLGLFISRQILELHGGTLEVWSERGKGSRFFFELPLKGKETK